MHTATAHPTHTAPMHEADLTRLLSAPCETHHTLAVERLLRDMDSFCEWVGDGWRANTDGENETRTRTRLLTAAPAHILQAALMATWRGDQARVQECMQALCARYLFDSDEALRQYVDEAAEEVAA